MKIVCLSDTHDRHRHVTVPDGDMVVHAGDFTGYGVPEQIEAFAKWFGALPHKHKICIAGNHDRLFHFKPERARKFLTDNGIIYLQDSEVVIDGVKFYGTPWTPEFFPENWVFNTPRKDPKTRERWAAIPDDTDVLIVHGPPHGYRDACPDDYSYEPWTDRYRWHRVGCELLTQRIEWLKLKYVVCGHIHESYGTVEMPCGTTVVNAAICTGNYDPTNLPIVIEI